MSSSVMRMGLLAGLAILVAGAIALAQTRGAAEPAGRGSVDVFNSVEGRVVVITSRPDGSRVEKKVRFALEQAQTKLKVLVDYSKDRTIKALTGAVETARARELAKQAELERARSAERRLTDQIARCKVAAPAGGRIEYAAPIGAGAVVHDGQLLFRVVPAGMANVKTK